MADKPLTPKQELFVQGLFSGLTQREAYKQAFNAENMSLRTIDKRASELYLRGDIKGRLKELQAVIADRTAGITVDWVAEQYAKIAGVNLKDFVEWGQRDIPITDSHGNPLYDDYGNPRTRKGNYVDFINSNQVDGTMVSEVKLGKDGASIKVHDRMKALDALAKWLGMFVDKHEITGDIVFSIAPAPKPEGIE